MSCTNVGQANIWANTGHGIISISSMTSLDVVYISINQDINNLCLLPNSEFCLMLHNYMPMDRKKLGSFIAFWYKLQQKNSRLCSTVYIISIHSKALQCQLEEYNLKTQQSFLLVCPPLYAKSGQYFLKGARRWFPID